MKISELRKFFDDYGMQRCYLVPLKKKIENVDGRKLQGYKEGWIEFSDKIYAKLAEYQLNGKRIGGSKKCPYKDELWNLKYLHKFKWNDLIENLTMAKKMQEKKLKLEIAQSKRENDFIVKNFEKSKKFLKKKKHEEKEDKEGKEDNNNQNIKDYSKYKQKKFIK
jgi:ESF2/ABP1 family protein